MIEKPRKDALTLETVEMMISVLSSCCEEGIQLPNEWYAPGSVPEEWWDWLPIGEIASLLEVMRS